MTSPRRSSKQAPGCFLVFGENEHDQKAIRLLAEGVRPDLAGAFQCRRRPLVLIKGARPDKAKSNAEQIAEVARQESAIREVAGVLAHEDCDELEPAHEVAGNRIESALREAGCPQPVAVTPAWELETWWLLFPEAVGKVVKGWRTPDDWLGRDLGRLRNAKELLARAVRDPRNASAREYSENDAVEIASHVVSLGLLHSFQDGQRMTPGRGVSQTWTRSASFERFRKKVIGLRR